MNCEYHRWYSPSLERDMELLVFGHAGARVADFPHVYGAFLPVGRYEAWLLTLSEHLEKGWLQLFCVDSVDSESWYAKQKHPAERALRHIQYDQLSPE